MALYGPNEYFNVNMEDGKIPQHIRGIVCDVRNCAYHDGDGFCTANRIEVGTTYANRSSDTMCVTFKPKYLTGGTM